MNSFLYPSMVELQRYTIASHPSFAEFVENVVRLLNVNITMSYDPDCENIEYNLNTGAKSSAVLISQGPGQDSAKVYMRYDKIERVKSISDLLDVVLDCMCGKSFIDQQWLNALVHYGFLKVKTTTVTEIVRPGENT